MEKLMSVPGLIVKTEILNPVHAELLPDTCVLEATNPYANYYGEQPEKSKPNSLFLVTANFYFLEEVLGFASELEKHTGQKANLASAQINLGQKQLPAIRVKNYPDYRQLKNLQHFLACKDVIFARKQSLSGKAKVVTSKLFTLETLENGFFGDKNDPNEGYFTTSKQLFYSDFDPVQVHIKNNTDCRLFDAAPGKLILAGQAVEMVRVYAKNIDLPLLKCLKHQVEQMA